MRHGKRRGHGRGRHRNAGSPETKRWHELERELQGDAWKRSKPRREKPKPQPARPPAKPPWMDAGEYEALLELRGTL